MAVIPPDAGVRIRSQADPGQVQSLAPIRGVPQDLPDFQTGQVFSARIQELLPDNTYRALVAGKLLTLQLPEGANSGDVLELTVVDKTPQSVIARRTEGNAPPTQADARPYQFSRISDAGRLIGQLLPPEGESAAPAALNRGLPLLSGPPLSPADLAPALQKAVSQSGVFYEAHQAQWFVGERSLASLRAEPQGALPSNVRLTLVEGQGPAQSRAPAVQFAHAATNSAATPATAQQSATPALVAESLLARSDAQSQGSATVSSQAQGNAAVPDAIRSIVQQQLDAVATQRLAWHGEVWPGQTVDWSIQRDTVEEREGRTGAPAEVLGWSTSLKLTLPSLGTVAAILKLSGDRLNIRVAANPDVSGSLRQQASELATAIAAIGLNVSSVEIRDEE